jgi:hypothetical protein
VIKKVIIRPAHIVYQGLLNLTDDYKICITS